MSPFAASPDRASIPGGSAGCPRHPRAELADYAACAGYSGTPISSSRWRAPPSLEVTHRTQRMSTAMERL